LDLIVFDLLKTDELSEQKLRISLIEKKGEEATKELEEKNKKLLKINEDLKIDYLSKDKYNIMNTFVFICSKLIFQNKNIL
jgi:hypothetical protein